VPQLLTAFFDKFSQESSIDLINQDSDKKKQRLKFINSIYSMFMNTSGSLIIKEIGWRMYGVTGERRKTYWLQ